MSARASSVSGTKFDFAATPSGGPVSGGTVVTIFPAPKSGFVCHFGSALVPVRVSQEGAATCTSPAAADGPEMVQLQVGAASSAPPVARGTVWRYFQNPSIGSLSPNQLAPGDGGEFLVVHGTGFTRMPWAPLCRFGSVTSPGRFISTEAVACPIADAPGLVGRRLAVSVSLNQQDWHDSGFFVDSAGSVDVFGIDPAIVLSDGRSTAKIRGTNLDQLAGHSARLVWAETGRRYRVDIQSSSFNEAVIVVPRIEGRAATLQIESFSHNSNEPVADRARIACVPPVLLNRVEPNHKIAGRPPMVSVSGSYFPPGHRYLCAYRSTDDATTYGQATALSSTVLSCSLPAGGADAGVSGVSIHHASVPGTPLSDELRVYEYEAPSGAEFWPAAMSENGGVAVTVQGIGFSRHVAHRCRFGHSPPVAATWRNDTAIVCAAAPPHAPGSVALAVSFAGEEWINLGKVLYEGAHAAAAVTPAEGTAGTLVQISGGVAHTSSEEHYFFCRFGQIEVPAQLLNPGNLQCAAPAATSARALPRMPSGE